MATQTDDQYNAMAEEDPMISDSGPSPFSEEGITKQLTALNNAFGFSSAMILLCVLSIVYIISAVVICVNTGCEGSLGYATIWAIFCGGISTAVCISILILLSVAPKTGMDLSKVLTPIKRVTSITLMILWTAGVAVGTFYAPFTTTSTSNGYLSVWGALFVSVYLFCQSFGSTQTTSAQDITNTAQLVATKLKLSAGMLFSILLILVASIVELIEASIVYATMYNAECNLAGECGAIYPTPAYAVSAGVISILAAAAAILIQVYVQTDSKAVIMMVLAIVLVVWWLAAALVLTNSLFIALGNGYFSIYVALIGSVTLLTQTQFLKAVSKLVGTNVFQQEANNGAAGPHADPQEQVATHESYNAMGDAIEDEGTDF